MSVNALIHHCSASRHLCTNKKVNNFTTKSTLLFSLTDICSCSGDLSAQKKNTEDR